MKDWIVVMMFAFISVSLIYAISTIDKINKKIDIVLEESNVQHKDTTIILNNNYFYPEDFDF